MLLQVLHESRLLLGEMIVVPGRWAHSWVKRLHRDFADVDEWMVFCSYSHGFNDVSVSVLRLSDDAHHYGRALLSGEGQIILPEAVPTPILLEYRRLFLHCVSITSGFLRFLHALKRLSEID